MREGAAPGPPAGDAARSPASGRSFGRSRPSSTAPPAAAASRRNSARPIFRSGIDAIARSFRIPAGPSLGSMSRGRPPVRTNPGAGGVNQTGWDPGPRGSAPAGNAGHARVKEDAMTIGVILGLALGGVLLAAGPAAAKDGGRV